MSVTRQILVLLALTAAGAAGTQWLHPRAPQWYQAEEPLRDDEVTVADISRRWHDDVLWIDARPREQFAKAHVPGAININEQQRDDQLFENIALLQDNKRPVVVYCDSSACQASRKMHDYLAERLSIEEIVVLRGGWSEWLKAHPMP